MGFRLSYHDLAARATERVPRDRLARAIEQLSAAYRQGRSIESHRTREGRAAYLVHTLPAHVCDARRLLQDELEAELRKAGVNFQPCDGLAADGDYREHGVAVVLPRDQAVMLARRFGQLAIFWFDGRAFMLVGAASRKPPEKLPKR